MRTIELDVQAVKLRILRMAKDQNLDSDVLIAALADVVGLTAATLDMRTGEAPLDDRLASFVERVRAQHGRVMRMARTAGQSSLCRFHHS